MSLNPVETLKAAFSRRTRPTQSAIVAKSGPVGGEKHAKFSEILRSVILHPEIFRAAAARKARNSRSAAAWSSTGNTRRSIVNRASETLDGGDKSAPIPLDPLLQQIDLAPENFPALEAFLRALNDDGYDRTVPTQVPSGLPVAGN